LSLVPEGFVFGAATAGFQIEGGYNGPGEPRNNWFDWEAEGRVEPSGIAVDFWRDYEEHLDRAVAAGCDAFRLSVEWARCEPAPGELDEDAFATYRAILDACHDRGLLPLVTLHHFTHPHWLGDDFWIHLDAPERFAQWAAAAVERLGDRCRHWVTLNEINIYALMTFWLGAFPPGRLMSTGDVVRTLDHLLCGHVLAYDEIHRRHPGAVVATNNFCFSVYELDRLLSDVLLARRHEVERPDLERWLDDRRAAYTLAMGAVPRRERWVRRLVAQAVPMGQALPRSVAAVYGSPHECTLDVTQLDYYDPMVWRHFRAPGHATAGGRTWLPFGELWDDPPDPSGFAHFSQLNHEPGLELWVVENGLCNRLRNGRSYERLDGWDRPRYIREHLAEVVDLVDQGLPLGAYFHWTLVDNYEWGSYQPRFGLYGVDRERGGRISDRDAMGRDAAGAYRELIEGIRAGDRSVL